METRIVFLLLLVLTIYLLFTVNGKKFIGKAVAFYSDTVTGTVPGSPGSPSTVEHGGGGRTWK